MKSLREKQISAKEAVEDPAGAGVCAKAGKRILRESVHSAEDKLYVIMQFGLYCIRRDAPARDSESREQGEGTKNNDRYRQRESFDQASAGKERDGPVRFRICGVGDGRFRGVRLR